MSNEEWGDAKEVESNWFKFNEVGDKIKGTLVKKRYQEATTEGFPNQWIYEIKQEDESLWNVGVSEKKTGTIQRLNSCKVGEIIGIAFESEGESAIKGGAKAKNLKVYSFGMDDAFALAEEVGGKVVDEGEIPADGIDPKFE